MQSSGRGVTARALEAVEPLRIRHFRFLWIGQTVSAVGSSFGSVALVWLILERTDSGLAVASVLLVLSVPGSLATLLGGAAIDRFDARTVMLWSDLARAVAASLIAVLAGVTAAPIWAILGVVALYGIAGGFFSPTIGTLVPKLVPQKDLYAANALSGVIGYAGMTLGILPAAVVIAVWGTRTAFAFDAATFVISFLAVAVLPPLIAEPGRGRLAGGAIAALAFAWRVRWLAALLLMDTAAAASSIGPMGVGLPLLARNELHSGAVGYGVLRWSFGIGSILGTLAPVAYTARGMRGRAFCLVQFVEGLAFASVAVTALPVAATLVGLAAFFNGYLAVMAMPLFQTAIPSHMVGRVMGLLALASTGFVPLSYLITGVVVGRFGVHALFIGAGAAISVAAVLGYLVPQVRALE